MVLKHITVLYYTMTVLLEYIDRSQHFSQILNIAINIYFTPYYA